MSLEASVSRHWPHLPLPQMISFEEGTKSSGSSTVFSQNAMLANETLPPCLSKVIVFMLERCCEMDNCSTFRFRDALGNMKEGDVMM